MGTNAIRTVDEGAVRSLVLDRPKELNTITSNFRRELDDAISGAEADRAIKVLLLRAEGRAFCAGFALEAGFATQVAASDGRVWDSVSDLHMISAYAKTWSRLHECSKPVIAAVQGWCLAGGTDMVFNCDLVLAGQGATFGYPPSRVWGVPEAPWLWISRLGLERTKRYLLTGDEIPAAEAAAMGMILECCPDDELQARAMALAQRIALLPLNQLQMLKLVCNEVAARQYGPASSRLLGCLFDGVARHTQEGQDWVELAIAKGAREAVCARDEAFADYGSRPSTA